MISENPLPNDRPPAFFRGLLLAFLGCAALYGAAALLAGCATDPATGDVTITVPAAVADAATNAAARAVVVLREARERDEAPLPADAGEAGFSSSSTPQDTPGPATPDAGAGAGVARPILDFRYGGFMGGSAKEDSRCRISNFKMGGSGCSLKWETAIPGDWARDRDGLVIAAIFYKDGDRWIGGKFDWIDRSRSTRDFKNIDAGYGGWNASAFRAAAKHAFCVVSADGRHRSNLIAD